METSAPGRPYSNHSTTQASPRVQRNPTMDETTLLKIKQLHIFSKRINKLTDFDRTVGHIEDILVDEEFYNLQKDFLETHWYKFDESEENKHEYMEIFTNYTNSVEQYITEILQSKMANFSMENFTTELEERRNELDGEVFDVLYTLTDFTAFKEMFLDYRKIKLNGEMDLSSAITVSSVKTGPQTNE